MKQIYFTFEKYSTKITLFCESILNNYMQSIKSSNYSIYFSERGYTSLNLLINENKYSNIFVIVDSNTNEKCLHNFLPYLSTDLKIEIIEFENGEINKNLETCLEIWKVLTDFGADRKTLIINLGGGVVTDLGGFVASTFKRGIDFVNIPTTLLAMVDASIGGKNGVDLGNLKNQIGTITNPKMVLIDTDFLETLDQLEMRSGLAEMLKHGLIADANYWKKFLDLSLLDTNNLNELIFDSIIIKNKIVTEDPTENGIRKALNFGHTLGHAIESYFLTNDAKKTLLHGEAIAVGMILESFISSKKNLISTAEYLEIKSTINSIFDKIIFEDCDLEPIFDLLIHDKKNEYGTVQFALLNGIGNIKINQIVDKEIIKNAFSDYKNG